MTLIKSISGIRGTIGGVVGDALTPLDVVKFTAAYGMWIKSTIDDNLKIVIGRDARPSGEMVNQLVVATLIGLGFEVIDLGLSTTPTVEIAVPLELAAGGIILTASHNPVQWNALKLLNSKGEFISAAEGQTILDIAEQEAFEFAEIKKIGSYRTDDSYVQKHIEAVLALPLVNKAAIEQANFSIVVDAVNSSGGFVIPALLRALGVKNIVEINCEPTGHFAHNPEPLPQHLTELINEMKGGKHDLGIVVDPDVDRLAFVCEDGETFGEEYTLVAVADYVLSKTPGNTVSNLSSTMALRDVTEKYKQIYTAAAVGEVNVVAEMKATNAIIGGEGNGGVIYPELHYGRDALVGVALFLSHLAEKGKSAGWVRNSYPDYFISKNKIELTPTINVDDILVKMAKKYAKYPVNTIDGVKIQFDNEWVHLRKSNTEPIIRIYAEAEHETTANQLCSKIIEDIKELI